MREVSDVYSSIQGSYVILGQGSTLFSPTFKGCKVLQKIVISGLFESRDRLSHHVS